LCSLWLQGLCTGRTGRACKYRHYYNEMDANIMQAAKRQNQATASRAENQIERSNSPIRVKVVKELTKQRKVEVDLETGNRRSWVETTEFEVLDITEATPAKKKSRSQQLNIDNDALYVGHQKGALSTTQKSQVPVFEPGTCPVCFRKFKGVKGVLSHRTARNLACHPDKENQAFTKGLENHPATQNLNCVQAAAVIFQDEARNQGAIVSRTSATVIQNLTRSPVSKTLNQTRNSVEEVTPPVRRFRSENHDDSVIVVRDIPAPVNRRSSLRLI